MVQRFTFKTCACKAFPRVSRPHTLWKVKSTILLMPVPSLGLEVTSPCNTKAKSVLTGFEPVRAKPSRFQVCPVNHSGTKPTWNGQKPWEGSVPGFEPGTSCTQSRNHATRPNGQTKIILTPAVPKTLSNICYGITTLFYKPQRSSNFIPAILHTRLVT